MTGFFITLEGGEGSGKSTQARLLAEAFAAVGLPLLATREPGGTTGAESIRTLLLEDRAEPFEPMTEAVLFAAARVDHVRKRILPALREGKHVLCDRFSDSTLVYQGICGGLGQEFIHAMHEFTLDGLQPDLTLVFDIDPEAGLARAASRHGQHTRFEDKDIVFHRQVRAGFLAVAAAEPQRCVVVDASAGRGMCRQSSARPCARGWGWLYERRTASPRESAAFRPRRCLGHAHGSLAIRADAPRLVDFRRAGNRQGHALLPLRADGAGRGTGAAPRNRTLYSGV